jgi:peroxiredoxin (alkyl hydroperoxide reductase subunit C)
MRWYIVLKINDAIPDFELKAFHEDTIKDIKFSDYKGKWLVLIFYPADFTFICPTELEEAAINYAEFKDVNAEILSVSTDYHFVHKAWHDSSPAISKVKFPMLADPTGKLCREFGTYKEEEGISYRGTFIIDPDGILKVIELHDTPIGRNIKEILRKLRAAKFVRENKGEVCPASWKPGKKTLKPGLDLVGKI